MSKIITNFAIEIRRKRGDDKGAESDHPALTGTPPTQEGKKIPDKGVARGPE